MDAIESKFRMSKCRDIEIIERKIFFFKKLLRID